MLLSDETARRNFADEFRRLATRSPDTAGALSQLLEDILATIDDPHFPGAVLPRPVAGGRIIYYAVADTAQSWRELAPLLMAFVGISATDFVGRATALDPSDPVEAWLTGRDLAAVARFAADGTRQLEALAQRGLVRLRTSLAHAETPSRVLPRSTGQVLHEFDMALAALDRVAAEEAVTFLRSNMRLDALNLHFLEVRLDATFGDWERLYTRPFFQPLCLTRRPPRVTAALAEALYRVKFLPVTGNNTISALEVFRREVLPQSGSLFTICPPEPNAAVGTAFLLAALAGDPPDSPTIAYLTESAVGWPEDERAVFEQLLTLAPHQPAVEAPTTPGTDYRSELDAARDQTTSASGERARAVLIAAVAVQTLEAFSTAVDYVERLTTAEREALLAAPVFNAIWSEISRHATQGQVPSDWSDWLRLLPDMDFTQARGYAERASSEWPIGRHLQSPDQVHALVVALSAVPNSLEDRVSQALPHLVTWVQADDLWPNPEYQSLYAHLLTMLLLSAGRSRSALGAASTLLGGLLLMGLDAPSYRATLRDLGDVLPDFAGAETLDWLIDLAELTVDLPCPDQAARSELWGRIATLLVQFGSRLDGTQRALVTDLGEIIGLSEALSGIIAQTPPAPPTVARFRSLRGLVVALYTLTEGVGKRVAAHVRAAYPEVRVEVLHDLVNSPRLQDLSRTADLFVICWLSAKHAATDAIRARRPADRPVVYAVGKGSSSILREIDTFLGAASEQAA